MTKEEFNKTAFHKGMKAIWFGDVYDLVGVDFEDEEIAIWLEREDTMKWIDISHIDVCL